MRTEKGFLSESHIGRYNTYIYLKCVCISSDMCINVYDIMIWMCVVDMCGMVFVCRDY